MKQQRNLFQIKEQDKTLEELSKTEISKLPNKQFKVIFIKMLKELGGKMDECSENFNKLENIKKNQTELTNIITEIKLYWKEMNSE